MPFEECHSGLGEACTRGRIAGRASGCHGAVTATIRQRPVPDLSTGAVPASWGTSEPALSRWARSEVTDLCRRRAPQPTFTVFVGPGLDGDGRRIFIGT